MIKRKSTYQRRKEEAEYYFEALLSSLTYIKATLQSKQNQADKEGQILAVIDVTLKEATERRK